MTMTWIDEALRGVNPDDVDSISVKIRNPKAKAKEAPIADPVPAPIPEPVPSPVPVPLPAPAPPPIPEPIPIPAPALVGIPYGLFGSFRDATGLKAGYATVSTPGGPFTAGTSYVDPSALLALLAAARANKVVLVTHMTGGAHAQYITNGQFDLAKWKNRVASFNQPDLQAAVAQAVADGVYLCDSMLDEPQHVDWGGAVTPAMLDEMARYHQQIFPTLKTAVVAKLEWHPEAVYANLDFMIRQFSWGSIFENSFVGTDAYRDRAIELATAQHTGLIFSTNILDGGDRVTGCPIPQTGGPGTFGVNCRQRPDQIEAAVDGLTRRGCAALLMWRDDAGYLGNAGMMAAAARSAALLATRPLRYLGRPA
jgi:hypothetical protein